MPTLMHVVVTRSRRSVGTRLAQTEHLAEPLTDFFVRLCKHMKLRANQPELLRDRGGLRDRLRLERREARMNRRYVMFNAHVPPGSLCASASRRAPAVGFIPSRRLSRYVSQPDEPRSTSDRDSSELRTRSQPVPGDRRSHARNAESSIVRTSATERRDASFAAVPVTGTRRPRFGSAGRPTHARRHTSGCEGLVCAESGGPRNGGHSRDRPPDVSYCAGSRAVTQTLAPA